jgi:predicted CoA-binding protein
LLDHPRRIALVGASNKPDRPSFDVLAFLLEHDFDVTPVNPGLAGGRIHGRTVAASLAEAAPLDLVDIFRVAAQVGPVVDEAVQLGARTIWMQLGVVNQAAAESARRAGLTVVMNRCPKIEWYRLGL